MRKMGMALFMQLLAMTALAHEGHSPVGGVAHELQHMLYLLAPVAAVVLLLVWYRRRNRTK